VRIVASGFLSMAQFYGVKSFLFPLDDIRNLTSRLAGTTLRVSATVWDWDHLEEKSNTASTVIIESGAFIKFLGGKVRTFKPGQPFNVYVSSF